MARFLNPTSTAMYRLNFDALDGEVNKMSFAEPVPAPFQTPMGDLKPWSGYGGGAPVSKEYMPTKMRVSGRKKQLVDFNTAYHIYFVNRRFIDVVEQFQKEAQHFPVECVWKDKTPAGEYFFYFTMAKEFSIILQIRLNIILTCPACSPFFKFKPSCKSNFYPKY